MPAGVTSLSGLHILLTADTVGGVWHYAVDLAAGLCARDAAVTLVTLGPRPSEAQRQAAAIARVALVETDLPLDWLSDDRTAVQRAAVGIADLAATLRVDLVQLNGSAMAGEARFPAPVVVAHHSCLPTWWRTVRREPLPHHLAWHAELTGRHLVAADRVVVPSAAFGALVRATYKLPFDATVVHNGRSRAPVSSAAPLDALVVAGRLWDEGKNVATVDAAAASLTVPVLAAGPLTSPNGAHRHYEHLQALGALAPDDIRALFARRPVFTSLAVYEPFGLAALEAAQAGCALILADTPVFRELWDGAALFVPAFDVEALAEAARAVLADPERRAAFGTAASCRANTFSADAMVDGMARLFTERSRHGAAA